MSSAQILVSEYLSVKDNQLGLLTEMADSRAATEKYEMSLGHLIVTATE